MSAPTKSDPVLAFIDRWKRLADTAAERANKDLFLVELCDLLGVERPHPKGSHANGYVFERDVRARLDAETEEKGFIDLYKRDCFILEAKQYDAARPTDAKTPLLPGLAAARTGVRRDTAAHRKGLIAAKRQAMRYAAALPSDEPAPPFILVLDVGHSLELYEEFSRTGKNYAPHYLHEGKHVITLDDLADSEVRRKLALIWTDPTSLDTSRKAADATREIAGYLAALATRYEAAKYPPTLVAGFLTRCLFCMFAEDVGLLPKDSFAELLISLRKNPGGFVPALEGLFREMNTGAAYSLSLRTKVLHFNGGIFADARALPLETDQNGVSETLEILIRAAKCNWSLVEPAIFGTLLERALNPDERHKLGAHFTPRAYVERLIVPTFIADLRSEWEAVEIDALAAFDEGEDSAAFKSIDAFHRKLCGITVLDPACGSGNFLYVAYDLLKTLEHEVIDRLREFGKSPNLRATEKTAILRDAGLLRTVDPHQFLGLELNPRAVELASLVLWIGHLRWHRRFHGEATPAEPVLKDFKNIRHADAALTHGEPVIRKDKSGKEVFTWDRRSMKTDPATGREVPDASKTVPVYDYPDARPADWLALLDIDLVDYIIGNPPFLGGSKLREDLGDGYAEALWAAYPELPDSADLVMYWWHNAATLTRAGNCRRFGFITTNSLKQIFNRRVIDLSISEKMAGGDEIASPRLASPRLASPRGVGSANPLSIRFAIPDHPWVDNADGAAVRIAMTAAAPLAPGQSSEGLLLSVTKEGEPDQDGAVPVEFAPPSRGRIHANLTIGAPVGDAVPLQANEGVSCPGFKLHGAGFLISPAEAAALGLGCRKGLENHIRPYRNNRDLTESPRGVMVIDLFGLTVDEVRERYPEVYDHVLRTVKPERDANKRDTYRTNWWTFGEARRDFRPALAGLPRYIATGEVSKHRVFQFLPGDIASDNMLVCIALPDAFALGVLSSRWHVDWALAAGGRMGMGNDPRYNKTACFEPFPFPGCDDATRGQIGKIAESLDAHRKRVTAETGEGITSQYNALADLRAGKPLATKQQEALKALGTATLRQLHDELDKLVAEAYGVPADMPEPDWLVHLCDLNAERAEEEKRGLIRYLRPDYQAKQSEAPKAKKAAAPAKPAKPAKKSPAAKPAKDTAPARIELRGTRAQRIRTLRAMLPRDGSPVTFDTIAAKFTTKDGTRAQLDDALRKNLSLLVDYGFARHAKRADTYRRDS